ncbi:MAG: hypothetical protein ABIO51_04485 [Solirubrobacteraceae bacterium]
MTAHAGHWATSLPYLAPVVGLVGFLAVQSWRERRRDVEVDRSSPTDY